MFEELGDKIDACTLNTDHSLPDRDACHVDGDSCLRGEAARSYL